MKIVEIFPTPPRTALRKRRQTKNCDKETYPHSAGGGIFRRETIH